MGCCKLIVRCIFGFKNFNIFLLRNEVGILPTKGIGVIYFVSNNDQSYNKINIGRLISSLFNRSFFEEDTHVAEPRRIRISRSSERIRRVGTSGKNYR